jgi:hypothetical protein
MLTQGRFLISYQVFDNIQVNNIGQTHVREILKDTQAFTPETFTVQTNVPVREVIVYECIDETACAGWIIASQLSVNALDEGIE